MTLIQNIKSNPRKALWTTLFLIATTGIILMFLDCYLRSDVDITGRPGARRVEGWHERLIFPFYFTFISNMFGVVVSFLWTFKLSKNKRLMRILEIFMAVNLTVTLIVYWATLFPKTMPDTGLSWASNIFIHLVTPILSIAAFAFQTMGNKETHKYKNIYKEAAWHLLFPLGWLLVASILYLGLAARVDFNTSIAPGHEKATFVGSGAIYFFLDYCVNSWYVTVIYIVAIGLAYYGFTLLAMWLSNPKITK